MKKLIVIFLVTTFISGCASLDRPVSIPLVIAGAMDVVNTMNMNKDKELYIVNIPSRGPLADALSVAANGGGAASQLRDEIISVHNLGGGNIVVTSSNPELPRGHIKGAMEELDIDIKNVLLIYAGNKKYSDAIQSEVESKGIKYGFVDLYK